MDWWENQSPKTLNVYAGSEDGPQGDPPADSYNGIVVGSTTANAAGVFANASLFNTPNKDTTNDRTYNDIVAPGEDIRTPFMNQGGPTYTGVHILADAGTSFAAPHVTAAVALLQQFANAERTAGVPGWDANVYSDARVMKAVLMNSADKVRDIWGGRGLDMEKTILRKDGKLWGGFNPGQSVFNSSTAPLDTQLGTGQLNVRRALNQFSSGNILPGGPDTVPMIGWSKCSGSA